MNIFKKRISLILSLVLITLSILPVFVVNAANEIAINVKLESKTLTAGNTYEVKGGEEIKITTSSSTVDVSLIGYAFSDNKEDLVTEEGSSLTIQVPEGKAGTSLNFRVKAAGLNGEGKNTQSDWNFFVLKYVENTVENKKVSAKYNSKVLADMSVTSVEPDSLVVISATPSSEVKELYYAWDEEPWMVINNVNSYSLRIPEEFKNGSEHHLYVNAKYSDDKLAGIKTHKLIIRDSSIPQVSMVVTMDNEELVRGNTYEVKGGEKVKVVAESIVTDIDFIGYYYSTKGTIIDEFSDTLTFTIPSGTPGSQVTLYIEAVAKNDDKTENTITKTGWVPFILKYPAEETPVEPEPEQPVAKDVNVSYSGKVLANNSTTTAYPGEALKITATPADKMLKLHFKWDNDAWSEIPNTTGEYQTRIPSGFEPGSTHWLYVKAEYTDGTLSSEKAYKFVIPAEASDISMNVKLDSKTVTPGKTYEVEGGEEVVVSASANGTTVKSIKYHFGSDAAKTVNGNKATFEVPDKNEGTTLKLYVEAIGEDGSTTGEKVYTLKFVASTTGELDMEPWMEENDEIGELSINLRNDSEEEDKANKNIYALNEVVTYYIDYKNGTGKDITSEVSIDLELPLEFDVVSKGDGVVDSSENTITWTFVDGLKEDESGTLVVKVKYTEFTKSKYDYERIYPSAAIFKGSKEQDRSTVINLIVEEYDMEIEELHEPYMYGDANKDTFRPDATITRAEGALVLARIYGLNYKNVKITNVFSDLGETYEEAQKAIIAATNAGLINGYTNGTYKPNAPMTKAEFMKILACMVEQNAADEEIEGLEVKSVDNLIKVYEDSTRYYIVDGKKIYSHWALEEVTLLARLNMTPLSEDEDEIDLDENITRAEVAQLVNFYLLRAPASVTSKTKSGFSDVTKKHDLFADIIEATREAHTFSMVEEDGTEEAE